jgi:hypothetical protein
LLCGEGFALVDHELDAAIGAMSGIGTILALTKRTKYGISHDNPLISIAIPEGNCYVSVSVIV